MEFLNQPLLYNALIHLDIEEHTTPRPYRCTVLDEDPAHLPISISLQMAIGSDGPWNLVIGEAGMRANKDPILDGHPMIDRGPVLHFDVVADIHVKVNIDSLAQDTATANHRPFTHLAVVPDFGPFTYGSLGRYLGSGMNEYGGVNCHAVPFLAAN